MRRHCSKSEGQEPAAGSAPGALFQTTMDTLHEMDTDRCHVDGSKTICLEEWLAYHCPSEAICSRAGTVQGQGGGGGKGGNFAQGDVLASPVKRVEEQVGVESAAGRHGGISEEGKEAARPARKDAEASSRALAGE